MATSSSLNAIALPQSNLNAAAAAAAMSAAAAAALLQDITGLCSKPYAEQQHYE